MTVETIITGSSIFVVIVTLIGMIWRGMEKRVSKVESENDDMKTNYTNKFQEVKDGIHNLEVKVLNEFKELTKLIKS